MSGFSESYNFFIDKLFFKYSFEVTIEHCEATIKSIELQLVRVETCGCAEGYSRDGKACKISDNFFVSFFFLDLIDLYLIEHQFCLLAYHMQLRKYKIYK